MRIVSYIDQLMEIASTAQGWATAVWDSEHEYDILDSSSDQS